MLLAGSSLIIIIGNSSSHFGHITQEEFNKLNGIAIMKLSPVLFLLFI